MPPRQVAVWLLENTMKNQEVQLEQNRDPVTGEPGSHPLGTAVGSLTGAATGAIAGVAGGALRMAVGGVIGAIAGAAVGHGIAEELDPTAENEHWEKNYKLQPYYNVTMISTITARLIGLAMKVRVADRTFHLKELKRNLPVSGRNAKANPDWTGTAPAPPPSTHATAGSVPPRARPIVKSVCCIENN